MRKLLYFTAALLLSWGCFAQNDIIRYRSCNECSNVGLDQNAPANQVFTYGNAAEYPVNLVADDYGPRQNGTDIYDWHGGIDYNSGAQSSDMGDLILAIRGGTITGSLGTTYKRLIVQAGVGGPNYGYGHLFISDGNNALPLISGGCRLMLMNNNVDRCIVMVIDGVTTAIGSVSGTVTFQGNIIPVSNVIAEGDPIGPTGFSGLGAGAHLHLFSNPDNSVSTDDDVTKNPLQYVSYTRPEYNIQMLRVTNYTINETEDWTSPQYPGTNTSHIMIRPQMLNESATANRYNRLYDLNQVEVLIKKRYEENYSHIMGATHIGDIRIAGRIGQAILPAYMYNDGANPSIGTLTRQGIRPLAYATNGARPYDDFYFTDFITRIHKDDPMDGAQSILLSYCPMSTRYNDGRYQLRARVTDVRNRFTDADRDFTIDNYKPFIANVKVQAGGLTFYERGWTCNDGAACQGMTLGQPMVNSTQVGYSHLSGGMYVTATASEPLGQLTMDAGTVVSDLQPYETEEDGRIQKFRINKDDALRLCRAGEIKFTFRGSDHSSNSILAFSTGNSSGCVRIPKRNSATTWADDNISQSGGDVLHKVSGSCAPRFFTPENETLFTISSGEDCHMVDGMVTHATNGAADGAISLTVTGLFDVEYQYMWSNGATTKNISGLAPGTYSVTVSDGLCCEVVEEFEVRECSRIEINGLESAIHPPSSCNASDGSLYFRFGGPTGGTAPYQMTLYGPAGNVIPSEPGAGWINLSSGMYRLEVRDAIGCLHSESFELAGENGFYIADVVIETPCPGRADGSIELFIGGSQNYLIEWYNGQTGETVIRNLTAGIYSVTITDGLCTITESFDLRQSAHSPLSVSADIKNTCSGSGSDGRIILNVSGGAQPYSFVWNTGHTGDGISGVPAGTYCVTVTDRCGTTVSACYTISSSPPMTVSGTVTPDCPEGSTGSNGVTLYQGRIDLQVQGGTSPYRYQWSHGFSSATNLSAGEYCVTVTDAAGCTAKKCFVVGRSTLDISVVDYQHCIAGDCSDAFIDISANGDAPQPYNYTWTAYLSNNANFSQQGEDLMNIPEKGTYYITVRDSRGCSVSRSVEITDCENVPTPSIQEEQVIPAGGALPEGAILLRISPPSTYFTYSWVGPNGFTSRQQNLLPASGAGIYSVTISNGCGDRLERSFEIQECNLDIEVTQINNACSNQGYAFANIRINNVSPNDRFLVLTANGLQPFSVDFDLATSSATRRIERLRAGEWCLPVFRQSDLCNGQVCFTVQQSNINTESRPFVLLAPNLLDFFSDPNPLNFSWSPLFCAQAVFCQGNLVEVIPTAPFIAEATEFGGACSFDLLCGTNFVGRRTGTVVNTVSIQDDKCVEGKYCEFEDAFTDPINAIFWGLPNAFIFRMRIRDNLSAQNSYDVEKETIVGPDNYCYIRKKCNGKIIEYERTQHQAVETITCDSERPICISIISCGEEEISRTDRPDLVFPVHCCLRALMGDTDIEQQIQGFYKKEKLLSDISDDDNTNYLGLINKMELQHQLGSITNNKEGSPAEAVEVRPNPFSSIITVSFKGANHAIGNDIEFEVLDAFGKRIMLAKEASFDKSGEVNLDLTGITPGTYFIRVKFADGSIATRKIVKMP